MIVLEDGKAITLEELAKKMCNGVFAKNNEACWDGSCPAAAQCRHEHNGMLDWLRGVLGNERN